MSAASLKRWLVNSWEPPQVYEAFLNKKKYTEQRNAEHGKGSTEQLTGS